MRIVKKPEERKAEMIAVADRFFERQGFLQTTVSEIVGTMDVAKGLFYYYFVTKDDVVREVVELRCQKLEERIERIAQSRGSGREKLLQLASEHLWADFLSRPMMEDLRKKQSAVLYQDMCDRVYRHIHKAVERILSQAFAEAGDNGEPVHEISGMAIYGFLMMAREEGMSPSGMEQLLTLVDLRRRVA